MRNLLEPIFKTNAVGSRLVSERSLQDCSQGLRNLKVAVFGVLLAGAATYLFLVDPDKGNGYPPCLFRALTGLQCPGCGSTRALHQLLHGHPIVAFELNPLLLIALPFLAYALLEANSSVLRHYSERVNLISPSKVGWLMMALVIGFWIFRNTPFYPFVS